MTRPRRRGGGLHVVLLAGGSGTRFWPLSRAKRPKQFLDLAGDEPLIRATWDRAARLAPSERIWVVAPAALGRDVRARLPELRARNLIVEPSPRDTAPAVALACAAVARRDPDAVVAILPTDHVIRDRRAFVRSVRAAERSARAGALVCLGVKPDRPATGFGYLRCGRSPRGAEAVPVDAFVEKPDAARARRFLSSGRYLWNAGMFVWTVGRFLEECARQAPATHAAATATAAGRAGAWAGAERKSVDYAVMEKAAGVSVVPLDAGWDDVGSWDAAARLRSEAGLALGRHLAIDSPESAVFDEEGFTALVGVPGVVVVRSRGAVLVVARDRAESVKAVVDALRARGERELL